MSVFWVGGGPTAYHYKDSYIKKIKKSVCNYTTKRSLLSKMAGAAKKCQNKNIGKGGTFFEKNLCQK